MPTSFASFRIIHYHSKANIFIASFTFSFMASRAVMDMDEKNNGSSARRDFITRRFTQIPDRQKRSWKRAVSTRLRAPSGRPTVVMDMDEKNNGSSARRDFIYAAASFPPALSIYVKCMFA